MKEDKFLLALLGKQGLEALDKRYQKKYNHEECGGPAISGTLMADGTATPKYINKIIAKKQKIADLFNSFDEDEKGLMSLVSSSIQKNDSELDILSKKENRCEDYEKLVSENVDRLHKGIINLIEKSLNA